MRKKNSISIATTSLILLSAAGSVWADDAPAAPAKPTGPTVSDVLDASGLTLTGYVDATAAYSHIDSSFPASYDVKTDYNSFALNQAAFTLAKQPMTGFGGLVNVIAGSNPYNGPGNGLLVGGSNTLNQSSTGFYLLQAYGQWAGGPLTVQIGKMVTLAGAEVVSPALNTNVTRSILFNFEPVTHTGVRVTFAANDTLNLIIGANNGWTGSQELADGSDKTVEFGAAWTPNKIVAVTFQGYYGRDNINWDPTEEEDGLKANILLLDGVVTYNATSALSLVGSVDFGNVQSTDFTPSASWWGVAGYVNYAINDTWRVSLRGEYFDDTDGYLTGVFHTEGDHIVTTAEKLPEVTLTAGYDPIKNVELRAEVRADFPHPSYSVNEHADYQVKSYQGWLEALYKF